MEKLKKIFSDSLKHELITGSIYVFIGGTISSLLAFFLNIYFARSLTYQEYGTFSALLSMVTLLTIPSASLSAIIARYATMFFARNENARAGAFYFKSFKALLIFSISLNIVFLLLFPFISEFLKINQLGLIILVAISVAIFYLATLNMSFIQSLLKFKLLGLIHTLASVGKLISGVVLVFLGFNVYGALLATLAFSLIDFVLSIIPLRKVIKNRGKDVNIGTRNFTKYAIPTTIAIFSLSSFISSDVLLVKHYFTPAEAGLYGGLALVGRVVFYFTGPIVVAMFPLIVKKHSTGEKYKNLFYMSLLLVIGSSLLITAFYFIFPEFTIKIFLGGKGYLLMTPYLGLFGIFLTLFSINNVFINFFLSIKKTFVSWIVLVMAMTQIALIFYFHKDFYQIIYVSIFTSLLLLTSLVLYYLKIYGLNYARK